VPVESGWTLVTTVMCDYDITTVLFGKGHQIVNTGLVN